MASMNCSNASEAIEACMMAKLVPFLRGSPGVGKSSIVAQLAKKHDLFLIDFRLSQADPTDLSGFPTIDPVKGVARYVPMDVFPIDSTPLPINTATGQPYKGWLLFLDEFNSANLAVQKATYKLILDRKVGQHDIHKRVVMVCAGNLETDNAITSKLSTAMQSRLIHLELATDRVEWSNWAASNNIDYRVTSFIAYKPEILNAFKPDHAEFTFPCQRTWEFVSRLIDGVPILGEPQVNLLSGAVGEGAAREFIGFTKVFQQLPAIDDILKNPHGAMVPTSPDCIYAVTGLLSNYATVKDAKAILTYASRLPTEFTVLTLQDACRRNPTLINDEAMSDWINKNMDSVV